MTRDKSIAAERFTFDLGYEMAENGKKNFKFNACKLKPWNVLDINNVNMGRGFWRDKSFSILKEVSQSRGSLYLILKLFVLYWKGRL